MDFRNKIYKWVSGTTRSRISRGNLGKIELRLPALSEQRRIAGVLDQADAVRRQRRAALDELNTLIPALFHNMFGDPVLNTKQWDLSSISEVKSKVGSGATPTGGSASYKSEGISLIRSMNVQDGKFKWKNLAHIDELQADKLSNVIVEAEDVLLNITGASVARVCHAPHEALPARVNQHVCIIRPNKKIDARFLENMLLAGSMKCKLLGIGESGATRQAITKSQVLSLEIPLPPIDLQRKFSMVVRAIEETTSIMEAQVTESDNLFHSLVQRAFRGEL